MASPWSRATHRGLHISFTMSVGGSCDPKMPANQRRAIRAKIRFWRAPMRREAGEHENFFIAKNRDSESALRAFGRHRWAATTSNAHRSRNVRITKMPAAQALSAILTIDDVGFVRLIRIVAPMCRGVVEQRASRALIHARQHFVKQDSVFLGVLVYSGRSAFRFPSARSY